MEKIMEPEPLIEDEQLSTIIYIVSLSDYECSEIKHVFATLEAAMAYVEAEEPNEQWHTDYHLGKGMWGIAGYPILDLPFSKNVIYTAVVEEARRNLDAIQAEQVEKLKRLENFYWAIRRARCDDATSLTEIDAALTVLGSE
jgi:hypothetical protein